MSTGKGPCHQVKELWEEVSRPYSIRDDEKEVDWIFSETLEDMRV